MLEKINNYLIEYHKERSTVEKSREWGREHNSRKADLGALWRG